MPPRLQQVITAHDVQRGSNLDLILRGFNGAINRVADGLQAIALALSTPHDNSAEVKKLTEELRAQTDALQSAIDQAGNKPAT